MKYRDLTFGQVEALINKLGGPEIVKVILQLTPHYLNEYINLQALRTIADMWQRHPALTAHVRYDDPGHHTLNWGEYNYVEDGLTEQDFPVRGEGEADVTYEYITFDHDPTTQEVLDTIEQRGLRVPDFAETRDFHAQNPGEREKGWIVSLCGAVTYRQGSPSVARVGAGVGGLYLDWSWLGLHWRQSSRFLAVRKDT